MQTVYFISGLGADERAFSFMDLSFCHPVFVKWLTPLKNESLEAYARRLKEQITEQEPIIVGLSFGGMMSVEIAKQFACKKIILLSSAKGGKETPVYLRLMRYLPLHKLATPGFLKAGNHFAYWLMGIHKRPDKIVFTQMLQAADNYFLKWAINRIINWKNKTIPANTIHIHGDKDIILPLRFVQADYIILGGEHLMAMSKPREVESLLRRLIEIDSRGR